MIKIENVVYNTGDVVEHKLSGSWLTVLEHYKDNKLILRTKDFKTIELFDWEVKSIQAKK